MTNQDYYTSTWDCMNGLKKIMMKYASDHTNTKALHEVKSFCTGFVFPETVRPAVSVFPLSKTFLGLDGLRRETVEYRFSIDVHSSQHTDLKRSKEFVLDCMYDIQNAIKVYLKVKGKSQFLNAISTTIESQIIHEREDSRKRGLSTTASIQVMVRAYHEVNEDRIRIPKRKEIDYDGFFDQVVSHVKKGCKEDGIKFGSWITKISKPVMKFPAIAILPGNEAVLEERSNLVAVMSRPIQIHCMSQGVPKKEMLKYNILLADRVVSVLEKYYMISGYCTEGAISEINYQTDEGGFLFSSVIDMEYQALQKFSTTYE